MLTDSTNAWTRFRIGGTKAAFDADLIHATDLKTIGIE